MKKYIYNGIFIALLVVSIVLGTSLISSCVPFGVEEEDLSEHLDFSPRENAYADGNCIPNAKVAARVGSAIIDDMCGKGIFNLWSPITVSYDETNRLYRVQKGYSVFNQGGFVILNQDTGEVVRALRYK